MEKETAVKLRAALEAMDARIATLEHLVNDVIIGGLKNAAEEYEDDERFSEFVDRYSDRFSSLKPATAIIYGDDYSLPDDIYEKVKGMEGFGSDEFDEANAVEGLLSEIQAKIDALEDLKEKVEEDAEEDAEIEESFEIPSDEDLSREFDEYSTRN